MRGDVAVVVVVGFVDRGILMVEGLEEGQRLEFEVVVAVVAVDAEFHVGRSLGKGLLRNWAWERSDVWRRILCGPAADCGGAYPIHLGHGHFYRLGFLDRLCLDLLGHDLYPVPDRSLCPKRMAWAVDLQEVLRLVPSSRANWSVEPVECSRLHLLVKCHRSSSLWDGPR